MDNSNTEDKLKNTTSTGSTSKSSPPGSTNSLRSKIAKLKKFDESIALTRQQLENQVSAHKVLANEVKSEEQALRKKMEGNVNQHLAILVKLAGVDFRTPDGSLNSRRNNLNEALIAGCLARIKSDVEDEPAITRLMEEVGKRVLAERARNRRKKN